MLDVTRDIRGREAARLRAVMEVSRKINTVLDLEKLLDETVRLIKKTFGFDMVSVFLLDTDEQYLYHVVSTDPSRCYYSNFTNRVNKRVHISQGMVGWVIRNEQTRLANDVSRDPYYIQSKGTAAELDMPLKVNERCIGVLNIEQPEIDAFDPEDVPVLEILAEQIATAIESSRLHTRAREAAVAEERNRLARELHDDTVQSLIGLGRQIDLLRCDLTDTMKGLLVTNGTLTEVALTGDELTDPYAPALPQHIEKRLCRLQDNLDITITNLRLLSRELQPKLLTDLGLIAALEGLAGDISRHSGVTVQTDLREEVVELMNQAQQMCFYRLAQESLANILKHAHAKNACLKLFKNYADNCINLIITDDGVGFAVPDDLTKLAYHGGMGVINMRQRARETGSCLTIESQLGQGTTLTLSLCLDGK